MALIPAAAVVAAAGIWLDAKYNIRSDLAQIQCMKKNRQYYQNLCKIHGQSDWSFYHTLHSTYGLNDYCEAFLFEDRSWTYAMFRGEIGRLAVKLQSLGIKNRTVVSMYINNSPEFIFMWWALYKIGAIPAPVNTSITREPFKHCLRISEAEYFVCTNELFDAAAQTLGPDSINPDSPHSLTYNNPGQPTLKYIILYDYGTYPATSKILPSLLAHTLVHDSLPPVTKEMSQWPADTRPRIGQEDISQYLFTSGTTGLPKASIWPAAHSMMGCGPHRWPMMYEKRRRFYVCTPMFHGGAAYVYYLKLLPRCSRLT
jgi:fatty-acyl-CoA synthase